MTAKNPSTSEMITLQYLWQRKTATVGNLHSDICQSRKVGYTTILKQVQRMEEKGFIKRVAKQGRAHTYTALYQPQTTRKSLVNKLIQTAFGNSPNALIQHAIGEHTISRHDIEEIRNLLDKLEKES